MEFVYRYEFSMDESSSEIAVVNADVIFVDVDPRPRKKIST